MTTEVASPGAAVAGAGDRSLVACLSFAALVGAIVAGLGSPIVYVVSVDRGVPIVDAQWMLIVTLVVGVVGTPVLSRLSDGRLRRELLVGALVVVAAGSLLALLPSFSAVLVARCLQGVGYAMVPLTVSIARAHLDGARLASTLGILSTSVAVGVGIGNPVIGLCVKLLDYRAAFAFASLVAGSAAWWVARRVPTSRGGAADEPVRIDLLGALLLGGGLATLLLAIARGNVWGWGSAPVLACATVGVVLLAAWVAVELRVRAPLVDLRLACAPGVLGANAAALLLGVGVFGGITVVILVIQQPPETGPGLGHSVFVTGLLMLPMALASLFAPAPARRLAARWGFRPVLVGGSLVVAAGFLYFVVLHRNVVDIAVMMLLMGIGIGISYSVMPAVIVARTPTGRTASATGINQVLRLMGGAVGAALAATVLSLATQPGHHHPETVGYQVSAGISAACAVLAAVAVRLLVPARGARDEAPAAEATGTTTAGPSV